MVQDLLQQHLNRARQCMKTQADKKRSFRQFQVGDKVFLKLQPYIQTSIAPRANHKLSFKFYGPFPVVERINEVAYKLQLPPHASVHPVFHVSQLRHALLPGTSIQSELPICTDELATPVEILQTRWRKRNGAVIEQVKVRWSGKATLGATWEDKNALRDRFPHAEAWGQASSQGGGDVRATDLATPTAGDQGRDQGQSGARPVRARKPNARLQGEEWVTS